MSVRNEYYAADPDLQRENSLNRGMGERILPSGEGLDFDGY